MEINFIFCHLHRSNRVCSSCGLKDLRQTFKNNITRVKIDICKEFAESDNTLDILPKSLRSLRQRTIPGLHHAGDLSQSVLLIYFSAVFAVIRKECLQGMDVFGFLRSFQLNVERIVLGMLDDVIDRFQI